MWMCYREEKHEEWTLVQQDEYDKDRKAFASGEKDEAEAGAPSAEKEAELSLADLRARVSAMEDKLAHCVDDMRAARECTEVLPQLERLVVAACANE